MVFNFQTKEDMRNTYITYLFVYLAQHEPFIERLDELKRDYPMLKGYSLQMISYRGSQRIEFPLDEVTPQKAEEYYNKLLALMDEYGLNAEWALDLIHEGVTNRFVFFAGFDMTETGDRKEYTITWDDKSSHTKKQAMEHIQRQFEEQWVTYGHDLSDAGFIRTRKRGDLLKHMRWVFKRVCLKRSWNHIALDEHANIDTIRHSVEPIVDLLGLQPPKLRGGRPRK